MSNAKEIELPHGTLSEAARRLNVSRQWIYEGWRKERPQVVEAVLEVVEEWAEKELRKNELITKIAEHTKAVINQ